jgi:PIN domain nuclease of toxin-antitoxin system
MRLLLDTRIWIWNAGAPDELRKRVANAIQDCAFHKETF